jgi:hypothetical protein
MDDNMNMDAPRAASKKRGRPKRKLAPVHKPHIESNRQSRAGQKVTVACKTPNGIIMRAFGWNEEYVPVFGGGVKLEKVSRPTGDQTVIHGIASPFGEQPKVPVVAGYALTPNVDAELWENWLEHNKKSALVLNKQIFAFDRPGMAEDCAKEHATVRSGLEPLNPRIVKNKDGREVPADPRMPRGTPNITGITTEMLPAA